VASAAQMEESAGGVVHQPECTLRTAWCCEERGKRLAVGTGEQEPRGARGAAIWKYKNKYEGAEDIQGAGVMASDGFFPFPDAVNWRRTRVSGR